MKFLMPQLLFTLREKEYYTQKAKELNLALPIFSSEKSDIKKTISSEKIQNQLNYQFKLENY